MALLSLAVIATACAGEDGADPGATPTPTPTPSPIVASWDGVAAPAVLPNGWTVEHCDGDAPLLCVTDGDRHVGTLELVTYDAGDDPATLRERVDDFLASMADDRSAGCGEDYEVTPITTTDAVLGGLPAVHYGFDGHGADGAEHERVRGWMALDGDDVVVVTANAFAADGCLGNEGAEFTPGDLAGIEESLVGLVAATPLPDGLGEDRDGELANGPHRGRVVAVADWLDGTVTAVNGEYAVYDLEITDGTVISVAEIYLP